MTAWWRWSGHLKGRETWDDLKPLGEGRWKKNPDKGDGPAGRKSGAQRKTGLLGERQFPGGGGGGGGGETVTALCASGREEK